MYNFLFKNFYLQRKISKSKDYNRKFSWLAKYSVLKYKNWDPKVADANKKSRRLKQSFNIFKDNQGLREQTFQTWKGKSTNLFSKNFFILSQKVQLSVRNQNLLEEKIIFSQTSSQ